MPRNVFDRNVPQRKVCMSCSHEFTVPYMSNNRKFCSRECWWKVWYEKLKTRPRKKTVVERHNRGLCSKCGVQKITDGWYCHECTAIERARSVLNKQALRREVMATYGGKCVCCGESNWECLTIDHINGRRKDVFHEGRKFAGHILYSWLKKNRFPKENIQVLCFNCNLSKGYFGYCPHKPSEVRC